MQIKGPCYMVRVKGNKRHMMPQSKKANLHSLSHIRHQRDAGERPGGNARPYLGFFLPGPGLVSDLVRKRSQNLRAK